MTPDRFLHEEPSRRVRLGRDPYEVPELLAAAVQRRVRGRSLLLLSDFDGTLSSLVPDPAAARMEPEALLGLVAMTELPGITLGIVSGRLLADVRARIPVPVPYVTGLHGFEIVGPDDEFRHPDLDLAPPLIRASPEPRISPVALPLALASIEPEPAMVSFRSFDLSFAASSSPDPAMT